MVDDFKLIELVRQNELLYDKNHPEYRDVVKKSVIWKAIGVALGASAEFCRKRFRCLRDRFNKERKVRKNDMLNDPSLPPVYKKMLFLWDHLTHRRVRNPTTITADVDVNSQAIKEEIEQQILKLTTLEAPDDDPVSSSASEMVHNDVVLILDQNSTPPARETVVPKRKEAVLSQYLMQTRAQAGESSSASFKMPPQILIVHNSTTGSNATKDSGGILESNPDQSNESSQSGDNGEGSDCEQQSDKTDQPSEKPEHFMAATSICGQSCEIDHSYEKKSKSSENNISSDLLSVRKKVKKGEPLPPNKRLKTASDCAASVQEPDPRNCKIRTIKPSCNDAFCAIVKQYLDKIKSPERLSSARLQILTILHNELYSTYS